MYQKYNEQKEYISKSLLKIIQESFEEGFEIGQRKIFCGNATPESESIKFIEKLRCTMEDLASTIVDTVTS